MKNLLQYFCLGRYFSVNGQYLRQAGWRVAESRLFYASDDSSSVLYILATDSLSLTILRYC